MEVFRDIVVRTLIRAIRLYTVFCSVSLGGIYRLRKSRGCVLIGRYR